MKNKHKVVPTAGVEPARSCPRWILNPLRLPIPPRWLIQLVNCIIFLNNMQEVLVKNI